MGAGRHGLGPAAGEHSGGDHFAAGPAFGAGARTMLDPASVIGVAFDLELLAEVSAWTESQAQAGLQELLDHQLIREMAPGRGFDFGFSHHLVQETAYDRLDEAPR